MNDMHLPSVHEARLPRTYEAAKVSLAECQKIDECKSWADKAAALASYAKQANDDELLKMATRIKARAVRRAGELLKQIEPATGAHLKKDGGGPLSRKSAAASAGLSERQAKTSQRLANVPEDEFDRQVESKARPLSEDQQTSIDDVLAQLGRGEITRAESNERIEEIDPDWRFRSRVPTLSELAQQGTVSRQKPAAPKPETPKVPDPENWLQGRDPKAFNRALHFVGALEIYAKEIEAWALDDVLPHLTADQAAEVRKYVARIDAVHDRIATRI